MTSMQLRILFWTILGSNKIYSTAAYAMHIINYALSIFCGYLFVGVTAYLSLKKVKEKQNNMWKHSKLYQCPAFNSKSNLAKILQWNMLLVSQKYLDIVQSIFLSLWWCQCAFTNFTWHCTWLVKFLTIPCIKLIAIFPFFKNENKGI